MPKRIRHFPFRMSPEHLPRSPYEHEAEDKLAGTWQHLLRVRTAKEQRNVVIETAIVAFSAGVIVGALVLFAIITTVP